MNRPAGKSGGHGIVPFHLAINPRGLRHPHPAAPASKMRTVRNVRSVSMCAWSRGLAAEQIVFVAAEGRARVVATLFLMKETSGVKLEFVRVCCSRRSPAWS